jgi:LacI family transcriptional regulator
LPFSIAGGLYRQRPPNKLTRIIGNDNFQGGQLATEYLIKAGHRHIALVTGPLEGRHWRQRQLGYEAAMHHAGLNIDPALHAIVSIDSSEAAEPEMMSLFLSHPHCTALFAGNDRYALAAYRVLKKIGRQPGQDLSIVGYDDLDFAEMMEPPLSTIQPDIESLGEGAITLLLEGLAGQPARQVLRRVRLVERGSVCSLTASATPEA